MLAGLIPANAVAQTTVTGTFNVRITIQPECEIVSMTDLDFGTEGVLNTNVDSTNLINVRCTNGTPYTLALDAGTGTGATCASRLMVGPTGTVTYSIYTTAARTTVWCDGTGGSSTQAGTGNGTTQPWTGYGRVPAQTTPEPDPYTDLITVSLTF